MKFEWVMRLGWRDICLIELNPRACESSVGVTPLAVEAIARAERGSNHIGIVVRLKVEFNVRRLFRIGRANSIGSSLGGLERIRDSQRDVLTIVADNIVLERWAPFITDALKPCSRY